MQKLLWILIIQSGSVVVQGRVLASWCVDDDGIVLAIESIHQHGDQCDDAKSYPGFPMQLPIHIPLGMLAALLIDLQ